MWKKMMMQEKIEKLIPGFLRPHREFMAEKEKRGRLELWKAIYGLGAAYLVQIFNLTFYQIGGLILMMHVIDFIAYLAEQKTGNPMDRVMN